MVTVMPTLGVLGCKVGREIEFSKVQATLLKLVYHALSTSVSCPVGQKYDIMSESVHKRGTTSHTSADVIALV